MKEIFQRKVRDYKRVETKHNDEEDLERGNKRHTNKISINS